MALAVVALSPSPARAQGPAAPELVLGGHLYPRPYGLAYVYGRVWLPDGTPPDAAANQTVALYASNFPFAAWAPVATLTTDWKGYFAYHQTIGQNTSFRAVWQTSTPVQSKDKLLKLPLRVTLRVSRAGRRQLSFSGSSYPAGAGLPVYLQRMDAHGRFKTVASTTLAAGSTFERRWRAGGGGLFRALVPGSGQFGVGASRPVRVRAARHA